MLVVAADDGVMPQTIEAIDHAKAAGVPIVVAVNKIDRPDANPAKVRQELVVHGLQPEEWGGETVFVDVSAKQKEGLDSLLEMLLLQSDVLELKANPDVEASGPIIESRLDVGRGPVATMLVQRGTLHAGDAVVAGDAWGKVRAMLDENGERLKEAGPATPVEILGFDKPPPAGEMCRVVDSDRTARQLAQKRAARLRTEGFMRRSKSVSLEDLFDRMQEGAIRELNLIIKADVNGSVEAAQQELQKLKHDEVAVRVIHTGIGAISESDIMLAAASKAIVVGFNVRPNPEARALAEREGVDIRTYRVIYQLTEDIEQALVGMLKPKELEKVLGTAEVRALFKVSRLGTIAGCMVTSGVIQRSAKVRLLRDGAVVWDGAIDSLKHLKEDVREVREGFECGILLAGFHDEHEGDVIECYETQYVERTELSLSPPARSELPGPERQRRRGRAGDRRRDGHRPRDRRRAGGVGRVDRDLRPPGGAARGDARRHRGRRRLLPDVRVRRPRARAGRRGCSKPSASGTGASTCWSTTPAGSSWPPPTRCPRRGSVRCTG